MLRVVATTRLSVLDIHASTMWSFKYFSQFNAPRENFWEILPVGFHIYQIYVFITRLIPVHRRQMLIQNTFWTLPLFRKDTNCNIGCHGLRGLSLKAITQYYGSDWIQTWKRWKQIQMFFLRMEEKTLSWGPQVWVLIKNLGFILIHTSHMY